uniref:H/ACA ribonucleoprotein complex subunit 2 n=1 Tax=Lygus hesperus TaxID=30085 RepID=A0A0A9X847_LYGHE
MTKEKKSKLNVDDAEETIIETDEKQYTYEERCQFLNPIAQPLASRKLTKKIYKLIKKSAKKPQFWSGLKDVQKQLRIGTEGIVILAGDVLPIDIYSHLPAVCEDKNIAYCYVPSKDDIGTAMGVKRSVITVFLGLNPELKENYDEILQDIKALPIPFE